jgi:WD40 repeat protein
VAAPGSDNKLYLWDVETGKLTETLEGHEAEIYGIAFSRAKVRKIARFLRGEVRVLLRARG